MKTKQTAYIATAVAIVITVAIGIKTTDSPLSAGALVIITWAITPYIFLAILIKLTPQKLNSIIITILAFSVTGFGIWGFVDAMFISPDAQGGMVFIIVPLYQWALLLLLAILFYILNMREKN
ncbi:MAG: hypothetical protein KAG92_11545 [Deltaproteobacteria bacterium]|nr:hypothetical protein [Deltaproteobacteria bacterium]